MKAGDFDVKLKIFSGYELPTYTAPAFCGIACVATLILVHESLMPTGPSSSLNHFDKVMHFLSYFVLTGLWAIACGGRSLIKIALIIATMGIGLEIAQHVMELGRTGSIWDALANFAGCVFAVIAVKTLIGADPVNRTNATPQQTV